MVSLNHPAGEKRRHDLIVLDFSNNYATDLDCLDTVEGDGHNDTVCLFAQLSVVSVVVTVSGIRT